jgi:hypothetical protein
LNEDPLNVTSCGFSSAILSTNAAINSRSDRSPICGAEGINNPMITTLAGDQSPNADDQVIDVLRKLLAHSGANFRCAFAGEVVSGCKAADIGYGF